MWSVAVAGGCTQQVGDADAPQQQSPEQQSVAEYDIANDWWQRRGNPRKALDHALQSAALDESNADAQHLVALIYLDFCRVGTEDCRMDEAERYCRRAVRARDDFREAQNTLGVVLVHQKKYKEAIQVLLRLSQDLLYETPENAWGNLGWAYLENGDLELAIDALRRSTAVQPAFCVGSYRLGLAYEKKNDAHAAANAFSRALEVDFESCQSLQVAYAGRARAYMKLGKPSDARSDAERCVRLDQTSKAGRECKALLARIP